ncbi:MAG: hypothetical protein PVG78_07400 [Desulfobacterales bacterium]|jgi:tRNA(Ile2) C34 agmatinyltransferase TiaS
MRIYLGIDDTDTASSAIGTGKLARRFAGRLNAGSRLIGVVRQQLPVRDDIPYTSHNSAACLILDWPADAAVEHLVTTAVEYLEEHFQPGSDPGLCIAAADAPAMAALTAFGWRCASEKVSRKEAMTAAEGVHLSGHGGTNDGIIGAAAAVGLTASGWSGRFIEWGDLRSLPRQISVAQLQQRSITVMSVDRDAAVPSAGDQVDTRNWVRPRLVANRPVLLVRPCGPGVWENIGEKRGRKKN